MHLTIRTIVIIIAVLVGLDQLTKYWIDSSMTLYQSDGIVSDIFALTYVRNTGAAFGFLSQMPAWFRQPFFYLTTGIAIVILAVFLHRLGENEQLSRLSVVAILSGAIGNLIDRVRFGYVIDFLDFSWKGYHWPAFNVADMCITLGVIGLLWSSVRGEQNRSQLHSAAQPPG